MSKDKSTLGVMEKGIVYWITGLSGAGKTTLGQRLYRDQKADGENVVILDGDELREIINNKDYSYEGRKQVAKQYSRMCRMLSSQGIDVIICTVSMYDEVREWNRINIENYCEIYIEVPMKELIRRDQKQLYSRALKKELINVMGIDGEFEEPKDPDIRINNDGRLGVAEVYDILKEEIRAYRRRNSDEFTGKSST